MRTTTLKPGLLVSLDEHPQQICRNAKKLGEMRRILADHLPDVEVLGLGHQVRQQLRVVA